MREIYKKEMRRQMDLNPLITTIVTATAALTAIIGGFLISRVITLSSEQSSIRRRLREIKIDITAKEQLYIEAEKNLLEEDREDFIYEHYEDLTINKTPLKVVLENQSGVFRGRSTEELSSVVDEITSIDSALKKLFEDRGIRYSDDLPDELDNFKTLAPEALEGRKSWYELLYDAYKYKLPKRPKSRSPGLSPLADIEFIPPPSFHNIQTQSEAQAYQQKKRDRDTYKNEISYLKQQMLEQQKILEDFGKPHGMWSGLAVLVYASIVGIGYPITLLPYPKETYNDEGTRYLILLLFLSQLLVLFVYLGINMYLLTKDEKPE